MNNMHRLRLDLGLLRAGVEAVDSSNDIIPSLVLLLGARRRRRSRRERSCRSLGVVSHESILACRCRSRRQRSGGCDIEVLGKLLIHQIGNASCVQLLVLLPRGLRVGDLRDRGSVCIIVARTELTLSSCMCGARLPWRIVNLSPKWNRVYTLRMNVSPRTMTVEPVSNRDTPHVECRYLRPLSCASQAA